MSYYATFGQGSPFKSWFVEIVADDVDIARNTMNEAFGSRWAFVYGEDMKAQAIDGWRLKRLCVLRLSGQGYWRAEAE